MLAAVGSDQRGERGHLHSRLGTGDIFTKSTDQNQSTDFTSNICKEGGGG